MKCLSLKCHEHGSRLCFNASMNILSILKLLSVFYCILCLTHSSQTVDKQATNICNDNIVLFEIDSTNLLNFFYFYFLLVQSFWYASILVTWNTAQNAWI